MAGTFAQDKIIESYRREFTSAQFRVVQHHDNAAILDALSSSRVLNAALQSVPLLVIQGSRAMFYAFYIANAIHRLSLSELMLLGPGEETAQCSQSAIDGSWCRGRDLFLEKFPVRADIGWCNFINVAGTCTYCLNCPGQKVAQVGEIRAHCMLTGIICQERLLE